NPFDMGRVDADLMYDMVTSWEWGGSGEDIYHDTETRRNGITYRSNLARLIEQLINEDKLDKAEEIADLAMEKMPVDIFGYYTLLEPYISAYYEVENPEKAQKLYMQVASKYQENLTYYSTLSIENQNNLIEEIITDIERYRSLVDVLIVYGDKDFALQETRKFNDYLSLFDHFMGPQDFEEEPSGLSDNVSIDSLLSAPE
ncbi:MAG: hypothetical protein KJO22_09270, partial [Bacteroidia bacterium]|nr:hypothetical protein [Bacteroidia bacterium]